jgi:hypothetical protein
MTTYIRNLILPAAALSIAVFGLAAGTSASSSDDKTSDLPIACGVSITKSGYGNTYQGVVQASEAVSGSYEFRVIKTGGGGSATINQSGAFAIAAGDEATLGQASFGGPATVDAQLVLHWNGMKLLCKTPTDI